jgi:hypothetical protein
MHGKFTEPEFHKGDANTVGGYAAVHGRPAAFEGSDGLSYSVEVASDTTGEKERPYGAFLLFVRWNETADPVVTGHLESAFLEYGSSAHAAREKLGAMPLAAVKDLLEEMIAAQRKESRGRPWWDAMRDGEGG